MKAREVDAQVRPGGEGLPGAAGSQALIAQAIAPLDYAAFLAESFGKHFVHIPGDRGKFADVVAWSDLNHALETQRLTPPRIVMVRGGKPIPDHRFVHKLGQQSWLDAGKVSALLDQGVTMVVNYFDEIVPAVQRHADAMADVFSARVNTNLYAGWRRDQGFDLHWDKHDVIVYQVAGRKNWKIFAPTRPGQHRHDFDEPSKPDGEPVFDQIVEQGDLLYIPRGWWHYAIPLDEPSLHLTFSIDMPSAFAMLEWFAKRLLQEPIMRRDIPVIGTPSARDAFLAEMKACVEQRFDPQAMQDFLAHWRADRRARPRFRLPRVAGLPEGGLTPTTRIRLANRRALAPLTHLETGETAFEAGGRRWPCSREVGEALARLESAREITLADLGGGLDKPQREELSRLVQGLVLAGELSCDFAG